MPHLAVALCSLALLAAPLCAGAQPFGKMAKIGVLLLNPPATTTAVLWDGLRDLGYVEGRDFVRELRWSDRRERLPELARELVALQVSMSSSPAATDPRWRPRRQPRRSPSSCSRATSS